MAPEVFRSSSLSVIPFDLIASEILPRLPVRTLLRFKCINRFFYNYISSKNFTDLQVHHSVVSRANSPLIVFTAPGVSLQCLYLLDFNLPDSPARYLPLPRPFCEKGRLLKAVGCCNGLLCLNSCLTKGSSNRMYYSMILNPSTGSVLCNISLSTEIPNQTCSGFGYDSLKDDYKLVVVEYQHHLQRPGSTVIICRKVSVFSMKSRLWRCIEKTNLSESFSIIDSKLCVPVPSTSCVLKDNYLMHWLLKSRGGDRSIVCFDLAKEQWAADVPLPDFDDGEHKGYVVVNLGLVDGCLCLSVHKYVDKCYVWVMKEYGVESSWMKFSIDVDIPYGCDYYPIFARQDAAMKEILLAKRRRFGLGIENKVGIQSYVWYNLRDKTAAKELQFSGAPLDLVPQLLCPGSLANNFCGDCQTPKCNGTCEGMRTQDEIIMKIDDQVEIL